MNRLEAIRGWVRRAGLQSLVGSAILANAGCLALAAGGAAGAAGYAYMNAEKAKVYSAPVQTVASATDQSLADLGIAVSDRKIDSLEAKFWAKTATGKKVRIALKPKGDGTVVEVRVGTFGNEDASELIYRQLTSRLGMEPTLADPGILPAAHAQVAASSESAIPTDARESADPLPAKPVTATAKTAKKAAAPPPPTPKKPYVKPPDAFLGIGTGN